MSEERYYFGHPSWRPWSTTSTSRLPVKATTPLVKDANRMLEGIEAKAKYIGELQASADEPKQQAQALSERIDAESAQARSENRLLAFDELVAQRGQLLALAEARERPIGDAEHELRALREEHQAFIESNAMAIYAELESACENVAERYRTGHAEAHKRLAPIEQEWTELHTTVCDLLGRVEPFTQDDLPAPDDYASAPLASAEAMERYHTLHTPQAA